MTPYPFLEMKPLRPRALAVGAAFIAATFVAVATPAGAAPPAAAEPAVDLEISSILHAGQKVVGVPGAAVTVRGSARPYTPGASVLVTVGARGRVIRELTRPLVQRGEVGRFKLRLKLRRRGRYVVRAEQSATPGAPAVKSRAKRLFVVRPRAVSGSSGTAVRALQRRLNALGYLTPVNGHFGASTGRAVLAFRKVTGMARNAVANRAVFRKLAKGGGRYRLRFPKAGKHAEFDWSRQVLVLARGARVVRIVHASSGKPSTPTVFGHFHFYSKVPGYNSKGMYYSTFFVGGYAVHGYAEVPVFAVSHGCIRIPIASATSVYRWLTVGTRMFVYR
jgi:lipoprotein-anchoring transpeptidase ErfK/SrfK